jgi:hypothetical protein
MFRQVKDTPSLHFFVRVCTYLFLYAVFFGVGLYGIISTTFEDCDETPNAPSHRLPPKTLSFHVHSDPQAGGNTVQWDG